MPLVSDSDNSVCSQQWFLTCFWNLGNGWCMLWLYKYFYCVKITIHFVFIRPLLEKQLLRKLGLCSDSDDTEERSDGWSSQAVESNVNTDFRQSASGTCGFFGVYASPDVKLSSGTVHMSIKPSKIILQEELKIR